jgi:hypothetical protein
MTRHRVSMMLEALLWAAALCWLVYLLYDINAGVRFYLVTRVCGADSMHWAKGCPPVSLPWRSIGELILLGLLVWWPIVRTRIKHGYWMRNWDDTPQDRVKDARPASGASYR